MKNLSASADLSLDKRRIRKDNTYPVKLKITFNRERRYYNTTIKLTESDWHLLSRKRIPKEFNDTNKKLLSVKVSAQNCIDNISAFSFLNFEKEYFPKRIDKHDVKSAYKEYIDELIFQERFGSADTYRCSISALLKFKSNLKFEHITSNFLEKFERYLLDKGRSITTVGVYLRPLRAIVNKEIKDENLSPELYPFGKGKYTIPKGKSKKIALPIAVIKKIVEFDSEQNQLMAFYRDIWLFSFYCNGMNVADICYLKYENFGTDSFQFQRRKTMRTYKSEPKIITVILTDKVKTIIEKWANPKESKGTYVFPFLNEYMTATQKKEKTKNASDSINNQMRQIAKLIGYEGDITTYSARHSYGTILINLGAPMAAIAENFGHSSISVTENYFDGFETHIQKGLAEKLSNLF